MKYRLKIDFNWGKENKAGDIFDSGEYKNVYKSKSTGEVFSRNLVENNPGIFEKVKPIEMEGEIIALEHNGENDKRILIQTEQNLIDTMIGRTVKLIIE
jgi:hypothetical protein